MIAVVGSNNTDLVLEVGHFTRVGETQKSLSFSRYPGGKGANQAVTCKRLGAETLFLSCVGSDGNGSFIEQLLNNEELSEYLLKCEEPNGLAVIEVCSSSGQNRIITYAGANAFLDRAAVDSVIERMLEADILILQNEVPLETTRYCARCFHDRGRYVVLDPAPAEGIDESIAPFVDLVTPNESEARTICGSSDSPRNLTKRLIKMGFGRVVLKLGDKGSYYSGPDGELSLPAFAVNTVDTTAAGDVFTGALATALDRGKNMNYAMRFATAAAALSVMREGAQPSIPHLQEVMAFLNERYDNEEDRHHQQISL